MSIESAKKKLRDARKDLEEMRAAKGDHEEFDRQLSHFLSDTRDALDHLDPHGDNHEVEDWDEQKQRDYRFWYSTLKKRWKSPINDNNGDLILWLHGTNVTDKHYHLTTKVHQDAKSENESLPHMTEGDVPETLEEEEGRNHRYYFKNAPKKCATVEIDQIAEMVLHELHHVFTELEHKFLQ